MTAETRSLSLRLTHLCVGYAAGVIIGNTLAAAALLASIAGIVGMAALLMKRRKAQPTTAASAPALSAGPSAETEKPVMQSASNAVILAATAEYSASPEDVRVLTT